MQSSRNVINISNDLTRYLLRYEISSIDDFIREKGNHGLITRVYPRLQLRFDRIDEKQVGFVFFFFFFFLLLLLRTANHLFDR